MDGRTYRIIEIVGSSDDGVDAAIKSGIDRASETIRNLRWFEVKKITGEIKDGEMRHTQVTLKLGFTLEAAEEEDEEEEEEEEEEEDD